MKTFRPIVLVALFLAATCATSAELYKWVDEKGVTNYSNEPPKGVKATPVTVDDRISVYTPDEATTKSMERAKERLARPPQALPGTPLILQPDPRFIPPPPPPPPGFRDPTASPDIRR
jgi:uncharacterized protein DUF4124